MRFQNQLSIQVIIDGNRSQETNCIIIIIIMSA